MKPPPKLATRLLEFFGRTPGTEPLIGDLFEQFQNGQSDLWYWRQVLMLILGGSTMFRIAISLICVAVVVAVAVGMALATLFHTPAWHGGAVGMVGSFSCLV